MSMKQARHLHLRGATGTIRTAVWNDKEHLVVPVVAMVEGVVWASNSEVPEFVPAEELAQTPQQWNGRGCFAGHPKDGDTQVTANTPRTLEKAFGTIFDTASSERILKTRRLEFNVFVDPDKAQRVGPDAVAVVERLARGERIEVSVGCYVETDAVDGHFNNKEFHGTWKNIVSDHIAFLAEGEEGACSVAAGCGAPRAAIRHLITANSIRREGSMEFSTKDEALAYLAAREAESLSDRDVRAAVDAVLRASEPGYLGLDTVYPDDGHAIYAVMLADAVQLKRRSYAIAKDGTVTLKDDAVEVTEITKTQYEPKAAAVKLTSTSPKAAVLPSIKAAKCGCKRAAGACGCHKGVGTMADKNTRAELIAALISDTFSGFTPEDQTMLETASDARLEEFKASADGRKTADKAFTKLEADNRNLAAQKKVADDRLKDAEKSMTKEEWLAKAPSDIKELLDRHEAEEQLYRQSIIVQLKDMGANTEEELKAMGTKALENLARYARVTVPDFSARGLQVHRALTASNDANDYTPPDTYGLTKKQKAAVN